MRKTMLRFSKFAPAALVLGAFLCAGTLQAQNPLRGCTPTNPTMVCPLAECIALDAAVHAPDSCSSQSDPLSGCNKITGCFNLRQARARWLTCYTSRTILNQRCFNGGDAEHQEQAAIAIGKVFECDVKIRLPTTQGGCGDPCP